jgi:Adenylate and Guanylate cyclase catalytic domain
VSRGLPSGTVTFLFTDVEGSTKLLHEIGADAYAQALTDHRRALRDAFTSHGGVEVDTQGDAFFVAFANASDAVAAADDAQDALVSGLLQVRMGLHTGTPKLAGDSYVGADVHLGARIAAAGHGGQVLLSETTRDLVDGEISDLGEHRLKDFAEPIWIFQLGSERFPPLKTLSNTNLPRPASSFVGRKREVDELAVLLREGSRLVTLTGPGGSGKTRLAIEAAAELVPEFKGGGFWIGLAKVLSASEALTSRSRDVGELVREVDRRGARARPIGPRRRRLRAGLVGGQHALRRRSPGARTRFGPLSLLGALVRSEAEDQAQRIVDRAQFIRFEPSSRSSEPLRIDDRRMLDEDTRLATLNDDRGSKRRRTRAR